MNSSNTSSWAPAAGGSFPLIPTIMFAFGVFSNLVAIGVLSRSRREQRETTFYTLVCGLAVTDLLGTCLVSPITIVTYVRGDWPGDRALCEYVCFVLLFFGSAGLSIICAMSLERYLAINHAFFYSHYLDKRLAVITLFSIYVANTLFCALPSCGLGRAVQQFPHTWCFIDWRTLESRHAAYSYMYAGFNSFLILLTVLCNVLVCGALLRMHRRFVRRTSLGASAAGPRPPLPRRRASFRRLAAAEIQMVILLIATSAVVLVCSSPLVVRVFINQLYRPEVVKDKDLNPDLRAIRIAAINPILDPWIYILLRKAVLNKLVEKLKLLFCRLGTRSSRSRGNFRHLGPRRSSGLSSHSPSILSKELANGTSLRTLLSRMEMSAVPSARLEEQRDPSLTVSGGQLPLGQVASLAAKNPGGVCPLQVTLARGEWTLAEKMHLTEWTSAWGRVLAPGSVTLAAVWAEAGTNPYGADGEGNRWVMTCRRIRCTGRPI
ncbi:LOW QUALITY PROTEIN: prostaglandin E2 receptor EP4 subtype-like [Narcine bancroftii]|uniref:LOW QUALITY PROTEIN: prostaglandin E2 receptor EP4 subtype-like n=1 Tax=Narcine bancroftii TaxID=1343680 RepID=UPI00383148AB